MVTLAYSEEAERQKRHFGEWLSRHRNAAGLTQDQAAERSGLTRVQWARWENATSLPRRENCAAIADALRIKTDDVLLASGYAPIPTYEGEMTREAGDYLRELALKHGEVTYLDQDRFEEAYADITAQLREIRDALKCKNNEHSTQKP